MANSSARHDRTSRADPSLMIEVNAPSRLHFGLLSFGQLHGRQFGGVGAMIDQPGLRLQVSPAKRFEVAGRHAERVRAVAERMARKTLGGALPACRLEVAAAPPEHVGLGTGTQLALAVAAGIHAFCGGERLQATQLADLAGRGMRSAVGTYGFVHGGLLVDAGKTDREVLSPLKQRVNLPAGWRFVLICPRHVPGLCGEEEQRVFRELAPVPESTTAELLREVVSELLPAAIAGQFERFGESLFRYGHAAGMCFAARQGGAYGSSRIEELVCTIRRLGVSGVGQSSWGPTIFALLESPLAASHFVEHIKQYLDDEDMLLIAEPNNSGAQITRHEWP